MIRWQVSTKAEKQRLANEDLLPVVFYFFEWFVDVIFSCFVCNVLRLAAANCG